MQVKKKEEVYAYFDALPNVKWSWNFLLETSKEAAAAGAKLLCFPESFSYMGANLGDSVKIGERLDGPIMQGYCSLAR